MQKILFDTDLLGDDLLALFLMAKDSDVQVLGVTAYGRRVCALERCKAADSFLVDAGVWGITFVPGVSRPLVMQPYPGCRFCDGVLNPLAATWSGKRGNTIDTTLSGPEFIIHTIKAHPHQVDLLCTGPLTNVALALSLDDSIATLVHSVTLMGGTWKACGNSSAVAEANIYNDPEAASIVFQRFPSITFVPLDTTLQVTIDRQHAEALPHSLMQQIIFSCCDSHAKRGEGGIMPLHDVLAYMVLKDPSIVTTQACSVQVETRSPLTRGMLCISFQKKSGHHICMNVDANRAKDWFLQALQGSKT